MKAADDKLVTLLLPADLVSKLETLGLDSGRDLSEIAVAALRAHVEAESELISDIRQRIAEADRGEFASPDEVNGFFAKYGC